MFAINETNVFRASSFPIDMHQGILCLSQYVRHFDLAPLDYPFKK